MNLKQLTVLSIGLLALTAGVIWSRTQKYFSTSVTPVKNQIKLLSPQEFGQLAQSPETFVLDVHTPEQTHIPGTDAFIPDGELEEHLDLLPSDKSIPILVYCRSGNMSERAARIINELGYTQVYDLAGGTNAYKEQQVTVALWPANQDLGIVNYGEVTNLSYTLTNYTPLPLEITRVSTSCGCTSATAKQLKLGAYESTIIEVSFDPSVHKDDTDLGDLTRTIYLETDNPNHPELEANFSATVIKN